MGARFILAIDQGTTGTRAIIYDEQAQVVSRAYREFSQHYPQPGWVEHDPEEIWQVSRATIEQALAQGKIRAREIAAIGIANQRETTVVWDKNTSQPVYNAIVWQCRRTAPFCEELRKRRLEDLIKEKTGLLIDAYFSGTKVKWILDNLPGVRRRAERGEVIFGTIDSWLLWKLTGGRAHLTDYTNASRTMLFNIHQLQWDDQLLKLLEIPREMLPQVRPSNQIYGYTIKNDLLGSGIPLAGIMGDQQAALFGQACFDPGMAKNTYGTGCFLLLNTGQKASLSSRGLLTTIFYKGKKGLTYALEGSVFIAGAAVQWLREGLNLIEKAEESEALAKKVEDTAGVYVVPAFTGLGAPYWDMSARGAILGISRGTRKEHLIRATLESIAYQTRDVLEAMASDVQMEVKKIRVDGGAARNNFLMQFQADILGFPVERPALSETTALGAAFLAGLTTGFWEDQEEIAALWRREALFTPQMDEGRREDLYQGWKKAISRILNKRGR